MSVAEGGQRPAPRIDPLTASIEGRITTSGSGAPIRRAEVRAIAASGFTRLTLTDGDGRYTLRDVPAGEYRLHVSRAGYVPLEYGQRRPLEAATRITLKEGARVTANVALPRGGAISGRITDEAGEPLAGARLQAMRLRTVEGRRRLTPAGAADTSDDTGAFRVHGLPPGDYYIVASAREAHLPEVPRGALPGEMPPNANARRRMPAAMTIFYPGTLNIEEASRITLDVGGEARADMQFGPVTAAAVSGIVLDSTGAPVPDAMVSLRSGLVAIGVSAGPGVMPLAINGHAGPDGTFELQDVPSGPYSLHASGGPMTWKTTGAIPAPVGEFADVPITVGTSDLRGLTITTAPPGTIEVTVVADAGVTRPLPTRLEVDTRSLSPGGAQMLMRFTSGSHTYRLMASGPVYLQVNGLPHDWMIKAITINGVDVTDQPIQPRPSGTDVRVILTDRVTELTGTLAASPGTSIQDERYTVVIFPSESSKWTYPSRYVRTATTDEKGTFRVTGLPGNERYLAVAVDYLEDGEATEPEFLERVRNLATPFSLRDAERRTISVPAIQR